MRAILAMLYDMLRGPMPASDPPLRIDAGPADLRDCVEEVAAIMALQAAAKNLALVVSVDAALPQRVVADIVRIRQCLTKLLSNAVKFTRHGEVTLTVAPCGQDERGVWVMFAVLDTGIGITDDKLDTLFMRPGMSTSRMLDGSGLGLATVKQLIESMGGSMEVHSVRGQGSCFAFELPLRALEGTTSPEAAGTSASDSCPAEDRAA